MGDCGNNRCQLHDYEFEKEGRTADPSLKIIRPERAEPEWIPIGMSSHSNLKCAYGEVSGELYKYIAENAYNQWSQEKEGYYGKGVGNTSDDPARIERVGKMGEIVFSKFTGLPVDIAYREGGDGGQDFTIRDKTFDIKTALKLPKHRSGLVKAIHPNGKKAELKADVYIFGFRAIENREDKTIRVGIVGWQTREWIIKNGEICPARARKGKWQNFEVPYHKLLSIRDLLNQIKNVV